MDPRRGKGHRLSHLTVAVLVLSASVGLAWLIVTNTVTARMAESDPEDALRRNPHWPAALTALALKRIDADDLPMAERFATEALEFQPLAQPAVRILGLIADAVGDNKHANEIMTLAGRMALHDAETHIWLLNDDLKSGRIKDAIGQTDILLKTKPEISGQLQPMLAAIAGKEAGREALARLLLSDPPWRTWFLQALPKAAEPTTTYALLNSLSSAGAKLADAEITPFLSRLIGDGNFQLAFLTWRLLRPDWPAAPLLSDGDFDDVSDNVPFDWVFGAIPGAKTEIANSRDDRRGNALRITFANTKVSYKQTRKLLLLGPGRYRLSGLVHMEQLKSEQGLVWRVNCAEGNHQRVAESAHFSGTADWQPFAVAFTVPDSGCSAQWLQLEHAARTAMEQQISGEIWFDHMAIDVDEAMAVTN